MIADEGKYYLYRHIRLDTNQPFYVGIGTKSLKKSENIIKLFKKYKSEYKRAFSKDNRNFYWHNITKKVKFKIEIILESDDYQFIKKKEIEFVALYGRKDLKKGNLVNFTDGGNNNNKIKKNIPKKFLKKRKIINRKARIKKIREHQGVPIIILKEDGTFFSEANSLGKGTEITGVNKQQMSNILNNRGKSAKGFIFIYKKDYNISIDYKINRNYGKYLQREIEMIDKNTNKIIKTFSSVREAFTFMNKSTGTNISQALCEKIKTAYGFKWKYKK